MILFPDIDCPFRPLERHTLHCIDHCIRAGVATCSLKRFCQQQGGVHSISIKQIGRDAISFHGCVYQPVVNFVLW